MDPPVTTFWAKLQPYGGGEVEAWHPLLAHAADVGACFEALLHQPLIRNRLGRLADLTALTDAQIARLSVLAALHDLGKYNIGFQNRRLPRPPFTAGHVGEALAAFGSSAGRRIGEALRITDLVGWGAEDTTFEDLFITALGHHGRPVKPGGRPTPGAWEATDDLDPFAGIEDLRQRVEEWFPAAFDEVGDPLPDSTLFQHAFNGILTLADWLGSNEEFFRYAEEGDPPRIEFARRCASEALRHIGLDVETARAAMIGAPPRFEEVWSFSPRPAQRKLEDGPVDGTGSLTILEAPTGSGKTEAALIRYLRLFSSGQVDGLYFALPTRAAATQMHARVQTMVEKVIPDGAMRPPVVRAVPGYLANDDSDARLLEDLGAVWAEDDRRWRYRSWASERPKRYLAGAVVVGTIDQVLLSALAVDHSHLRAAALLRHLLVVDELHASDAYMSRLLEAVIDRHLAAGGHALLMSATLGETARHRYLKLLEGPETSTRKPLEEAVAVPYPVIVEGGNDEEPGFHEIPGEGTAEKDVEVELLAGMDEPEAVARRALEAAAAGARVLMIRNTVSGCRELQRRLEETAGSADDPRLFRCEGTTAPHHSRFAAPDRKLLDRVVETHYGKNSDTSGIVLSATQTVEQSLDIDADLLVTDLCPADVLLQRIGRLHRHERSERPAGFRRARVIVLVPESRQLGEHIATKGRNAGRAWGPHGIGTVYEDLRTLEATWRELESRSSLRLPRDNRSIVEGATHPEALEAITEELEGPWVDHERTVDGVRRAETGLAGLNLADWSVPFGMPGSLFPERPDVRIRTRLGEGDRRAQLDREVTSPFGESIDELTIPAWWAPGEGTTDEEAAVIRTAEGVTLFRFGSERYRYDRLGLWRLRDE